MKNPPVVTVELERPLTHNLPAWEQCVEKVLQLHINRQLHTHTQVCRHVVHYMLVVVIIAAQYCQFCKRNSLDRFRMLSNAHLFRKIKFKKIYIKTKSKEHVKNNVKRTFYCLAV